MNGDRARVSVAVAVQPALAFQVFTEDIDRWWRRGPKFRHSGSSGGLIRIEPKVGGRLFESFERGGAPQVFEVGRVRVWDPPRRLAFSWRNANFSQDEHTQVEVEFAATPSGTLVTVTHSSLSTLRADHPARHGLPPAEYVRMTGLWWSDQLTALRLLCAEL
jgi:uncharacterized protein YndB with AHSA1/START domain